MHSKIIALGTKIHDAMHDYVVRVGHTNHWDYDLEGGCAVGSYFLLREMKKKLGLDATFIAGPCHAWIEYDGYIYDVTASQFDIPEKVFILEKSKVSSIVGGFLYSQAAYNAPECDRETIDYVNEWWPTAQRPIQYKLRWLNQYKARIDRIAKDIDND